MNSGITDPRDAITLPYLVPQRIVPFGRARRDRATISFSMIAFDNPIALIG